MNRPEVRFLFILIVTASNFPVETVDQNILYIKLEFIFQKFKLIDLHIYILCA